MIDLKSADMAASAMMRKAEDNYAAAWRAAMNPPLKVGEISQLLNSNKATMPQFQKAADPDA